jgi:hypothetical protein
VEGSSTNGTAVRGFGSYGQGVVGSSNTSDGVKGDSDSGVGVRGGSASSSGVVAYNYTSLTAAYLAGACCGGYFTGSGYFSGYLTKAGGGFQIDHPLDPEHKVLNHSFVESPDMKNMYDCMAVLDAAGEAWVTLPDYFEALNKDFRYQLTPIGAAFVPYVAEEVAGNRFKIAGGPAGKKVSWQVTGTRHDPYAAAHPIVVEEAKPADEVGTYLVPEVYGQPPEKAAGRVKAGSGGAGVRRLPEQK